MFILAYSSKITIASAVSPRPFFSRATRGTFLFQHFSIYFAILNRTTREKLGPGGVFTIPKLKPLDNAKQCTECGVPFNFLKPKYHCLSCGSVVCGPCSSNRRSLQKYGYNNPVRCCNTCDTLIQMQQMNSANLLALTPKQLKKYISAYNLPAKSAIEKDDLVRIILNTRPISNDSEVYYRTHRAPPPQPQPEQETSTSSPISNFIDNIFGGPSQKKQQREQEEQLRRQQEFHRQQQARQQQAWQENRRQQEEALRQQARRQQEEARQRQQEEHRRRQQEEQIRRQQQRSPPSTRNDDMLSLDDMIRSKIDPRSLSVRTLKAILKANFVEQSHALEKSDLVSRVDRLASERKKELADREGGSSVSDDTLCRICCDAQQNCVFLDCGHMVTCMDCGKQLVSSKNECPICREPILKLVHVFRS